MFKKYFEEKYHKDIDEFINDFGDGFQSKHIELINELSKQMSVNDIDLSASYIIPIKNTDEVLIYFVYEGNRILSDIIRTDSGLFVEAAKAASERIADLIRDDILRLSLLERYLGPVEVF